MTVTPTVTTVKRYDRYDPWLRPLCPTGSSQELIRDHKKNTHIQTMITLALTPFKLCFYRAANGGAGENFGRYTDFRPKKANFVP